MKLNKLYLKLNNLRLKLLLLFVAYICVSLPLFANSRTLLVWDLIPVNLGDSTHKEWHNYVLSEFEKKTGAKLEWVSKENDAYKMAIKIVMRSGNPPDVYQNWPGSDALEFIKAGYAADVTPWIDDIKKKGYSAAGFYDSFAQEGGRNYGLSLVSNSKYLYYNKSLFKKYDISPPKTFEELLKICQKVYKKNKRMISFPLGNLNKWRAIHIVSQLNGYYIEPDKLINDYYVRTPADKIFTNEGYLKSLRALLSLRDSHCFERSPNTTSQAVAAALFESSRALMEYSGTWNLSPYQKEMKDNLGIIRRLPLVEGSYIKNPLSYNFLVTEGMMVHKNSKNKDLAKELFNIYAKATKIFYEESFDEPTRKDFGVIEHEIPVTDVYMDNRLSEVYLSDVQALVGGDMTPEQVMSHLRSTAKKIQEEHK